MREIEAFLVNALRESEDDDELRLPRSISTSNTTPPPERPEKEEEMRDRGPDPTKEEVLAALASEGRNITRVAKRLRLGRNVVYRLMREYQIRRDDTDPRGRCGSLPFADREAPKGPSVLSSPPVRDNLPTP